MRISYFRGALIVLAPPLTTKKAKQLQKLNKLDGSLPAKPVNDRRVANAVTLKSTFCLS